MYLSVGHSFWGPIPKPSNQKSPPPPSRRSCHRNHWLDGHHCNFSWAIPGLVNFNSLRTGKIHHAIKFGKSTISNYGHVQ